MPKQTTNKGVQAAPLEVARRAAMQGIAGSLAGIATLGAAGASAKKKKKNKKVTGTLVRYEVAQETVTLPIESTDEVTALCPEPGSGEQVFVLGGGFDINSTNAEAVFMRKSLAADDQPGWRVEATNTDGTESAGLIAQVICGYFRTR